MPYTLPPISITANTPAYVTVPGDMGSVSWVKLVNASPFLIQLNNLLGGSDYLQPGEANIWPVPGLTTAIQAMPQTFATQNQVAPVSALVVTWFLQGEQPSGTYPVNFGQLVYVGNGLVATQLVNDGNTVGSNIIESTPAGATQSYILVRNDGTLQIWAISNNVLTEIINLTPGASAAAASLVLKLLQVTGAVKLDGGGITTDGNGNLTVGHSGFNASGAFVASTLTLATQLGGGLGEAVQGAFGNGSGGYADFLLQFIGAVAAGNYGAFQFSSIYNGTKVHNFDIGVTGGLNQGLSWIDQNGVLHATAPVTLAAGNQETGAVGLGFTATAAGQIALYLPNFKTTMSNTPTSITLTAGFTQNFSGVTADFISKQGFRFYFSSVVAGLSEWVGTYTTAGNCLLAVDGAARIFDHHCDACGAYNHAIPIAATTTNPSASGPASGPASLGFSCPVCGAVEAFNTALSAADEADTTPQGSGDYATTRGAQATLIRALMTALGLEVAP